MPAHRVFTWLFLVSLAMPALAAKQVVGWVEHARIDPDGLQIKAKVDTGAKTSSLNCTCTQFFEKEGEQWVRFGVTNYKDEVVQLERKVERIATIKRHFGKSQDRPVIKLGVCLGKTYRETEVNLVDRSGLNYQMLIGRKYMQGDFLIDPERTFATTPTCRQTK